MSSKAPPFQIGSFLENEPILERTKFWTLTNTDVDTPGQDCPENRLQESRTSFDIILPGQDFCRLSSNVAADSAMMDFFVFLTQLKQPTEYLC